MFGLVQVSVCVLLATLVAGNQERSPNSHDEALHHIPDAIYTDKLLRSGAVSTDGMINMNLTLFANATARKATCNDGTPSGYYFWPSPTGSTSWMIYLEGGGLCYDYESCSKRPKLLTSSTPWPKVLGAKGIFSTSPDNGFAEWNKVLVIYCTSDLYTGTADKGGLLDWEFHGKYIVPAVVEDLHAHLSTSDQVLFTGGSAGGVGVFMNYNYMRAQLSAVTRVRGLPDAGWFLTTMAPYSKKAEPLPTMLKEGVALWKGEPPQKCASALGDKAFQCYSGPIMYNFMSGNKSDVMVLKAQTDAWTLGHDGIKSPYTEDEVVWIMELAAQVRETFIIDHVTNVFSADCPYHTSLQLLWDTVHVDSTTLSQAVQNWYFHNQTVHLVDSCTTPACNPSCL